jgi:hypothetical protein
VVPLLPGNINHKGTEDTEVHREELAQNL